jgi:hypothetical protein
MLRLHAVLQQHDAPRSHAKQSGLRLQLLDARQTVHALVERGQLTA